MRNLIINMSLEPVKNKVIAIVGPTSSGKSALAIRLAKKFGGEVISADSRQVYKGLNIGTGKITKKEMWGIRHHMIDVVSPKKQFSVAEYRKIAEEKMKEIHGRGKIPIVTGGTGLYIDSLVNGIVIPEVPPNLILRKKLEKKNTSELFAMLKKIDPRRAKIIDRNNHRRLIRAIEISRELGKVPSFKLRVPNHKTLKIGPSLSDKELRSKIHIRLFARISRGMIGEARKLHEKGLSWKRMDGLGLEYRYLAKYLKKEISKKEMFEKLETEIWRYAKRQMTWWKRDKNIRWFDPKNVRSIEMAVNDFLIN